MNQKTIILLVEDSTSQALQFQLLLQRAGYQVQLATDGMSGWSHACDMMPGLILLDIDLPRMNGFQVLMRLKRGRNTAHIPVMMLTSRDHISDVERAIELGADDYLFKDECLFQKDAATYLCTAVRQFMPDQEIITA